MKHPIVTGNWWAAAGVRALKTFAQTVVALIGVDAVGIASVDWVAMGSAGVLAAILSVLTSLAGLPEVAERPYTPRYAAEEEG